jgi:hypothetical protein
MQKYMKNELKVEENRKKVEENCVRVFRDK